jgi:glycosyltransferase involved in cell wall biosynthesis
MAARVLRELPAAKFLIIGDGPRRESLEQQAQSLGIGTSVHFLGSRNDVPSLLSATDVFALTSHNEANPVSILEAMSVGRPVVATDVGSICEAVSEGQTGHLVPPGDAAQLTARVLDLARDPFRALTMGEAGREKVVSRWSLDIMVHGYERLIEKIYARKVLAVSRPLSVVSS